MPFKMHVLVFQINKKRHVSVMLLSYMFKIKTFLRKHLSTLFKFLQQRKPVLH